MSEPSTSDGWLDDAAKKAKERIEHLYREGLELLSEPRLRKTGTLPQETIESTDPNSANLAQSTTI